MRKDSGQDETVNGGFLDEGQPTVAEEDVLEEEEGSAGVPDFGRRSHEDVERVSVS